jgi:hypothetical protein
VGRFARCGLLAPEEFGRGLKWDETMEYGQPSRLFSWTVMSDG